MGTPQWRLSSNKRERTTRRHSPWDALDREYASGVEQQIATTRGSSAAVASFAAAFGVFVGLLVGAGINAVHLSQPLALLFYIAAAVGPPLAVALGIVALRQIRRSDGSLRGRGLATAGLVIGIVEIVLSVALIVAAVLAARSFHF